MPEGDSLVFTLVADDSLRNSTNAASASGVNSRAGVVKRSKPDMEKRRRARINASLAELRALIPDSLRKHLYDLHTEIPNQNLFHGFIITFILSIYIERSQQTSKSYSLGYSECAQEVTQFLETVPAPGCCTSSQLKSRLLDHLSGCVPHQIPDSPSRSHTVTNARPPPSVDQSSDFDHSTSSLVAHYLMSDHPVANRPGPSSGLSDLKSQTNSTSTVSSTSDTISINDDGEKNNLTDRIGVDKNICHDQRIQHKLVEDIQMDVEDSNFQVSQEDRNGCSKKEPSNLRMTQNRAELYHAKRSLLAEFEQVKPGQQTASVGSTAQPKSFQQNHPKQDDIEPNQGQSVHYQATASEQSSLDLGRNKHIEDPSHLECDEVLPLDQSETQNESTLSRQDTCLRSQTDKAARTQPDHIRQSRLLIYGNEVPEMCRPVRLLNQSPELDRAAPATEHTCLGFKKTIENIYNLTSTGENRIDGEKIAANESSNKDTTNVNQYSTSGFEDNMNVGGISDFVSNQDSNNGRKFLFRSEDHNYFKKEEDTPSFSNLSLCDVEFTKSITIPNILVDPVSELDAEMRNILPVTTVTNSLTVDNKLPKPPYSDKTLSLGSKDRGDLSEGLSTTQNSPTYNEQTSADNCNTEVLKEGNNTQRQGKVDLATSTHSSISTSPTILGEVPPSQIRVTAIATSASSVSNPALQGCTKTSQCKSIPSILIPIFVQTSFGTGEMASFQQAFFLKPSKDTRKIPTRSTPRKLTPIAPKLTTASNNLAQPQPMSSSFVKPDTVNRPNNMAKKTCEVPMASALRSEFRTTSPVSNLANANPPGNKNDDEQISSIPTITQPVENIRHEVKNSEKVLKTCTTLRTEDYRCRGNAIERETFSSGDKKPSDAALEEYSDNSLSPDIPTGQISYETNPFISDFQATMDYDTASSPDHETEYFLRIDRDQKQYGTAADLVNNLSSCNSSERQSKFSRITGVIPNAESCFTDVPSHQNKLRRPRAMSLDDASAGIEFGTEICRSDHDWRKTSVEVPLCIEPSSIPSIRRQTDDCYTDLPLSDGSLLSSENEFSSVDKTKISTWRYHKKGSQEKFTANDSRGDIQACGRFDAFCCSPTQNCLASRRLHNETCHTRSTHAIDHNHLAMYDGLHQNQPENHLDVDLSSNDALQGMNNCGSPGHVHNRLKADPVRTFSSMNQNSNSLKYSQESLFTPDLCLPGTSSNCVSITKPRKRAYTVSGNDSMSYSLTTAQRKCRINQNHVSVTTQSRKQVPCHFSEKCGIEAKHDDIITTKSNTGDFNREFLLARRRCASFCSLRHIAAHNTAVNNKEDRTICLEDSEKKCNESKTSVDVSRPPYPVEVGIFDKHPENQTANQNIRANPTDSRNEARVTNLYSGEEQSQQEITSNMPIQIFISQNVTHHPESYGFDVGDNQARFSYFIDTGVKNNQYISWSRMEQSNHNDLDNSSPDFFNKKPLDSLEVSRFLSKETEPGHRSIQYKTEDGKDLSQKETRENKFKINLHQGRNQTQTNTDQFLGHPIISPSWNIGGMMTPDKKNSLSPRLHQRDQSKSSYPAHQTTQPLNLRVSFDPLDTQANGNSDNTNCNEPLDLTTTKVNASQNVTKSSDIGCEKLHRLNEQQGILNTTLSRYSTQQHSSPTNADKFLTQKPYLPADGDKFSTQEHYLPSNAEMFTTQEPYLPTNVEKFPTLLPYLPTHSQNFPEPKCQDSSSLRNKSPLKGPHAFRRNDSSSSLAVNDPVLRDRSFSMTSRLSSLCLDQLEPFSNCQTQQHRASQVSIPPSLSTQPDDESVWRPWSKSHHFLWKSEPHKLQ
ncbi:transcription factor HES-1 [Elysia marginata]|uniref:Transcription factor HES-1 n=1 Tax=Elysia marginata TaxID=1093978 RepID=A0AAV4J6A9_9GAST|nr:transcription factor HES-1 [Elysia marginata]